MSGVEHLVVGAGEVGSALHSILGGGLRDVNPSADDPARADYLHICFRWSPQFQDQVREYQLRYEPAFTVIHSTVPVGTSASVGACHSPVRGIHPDLREGLLTFRKFVGGVGAREVAGELRYRGIPAVVVSSSDETEAGKLWELTQYGVQIQVQKMIYAWCEARDLDPEVVYREFAESYNEGYSELGQGWAVRPIISPMPGPIGGHCVVPGAKLLDHPLATIVEEEVA